MFGSEIEIGYHGLDSGCYPEGVTPAVLAALEVGELLQAHAIARSVLEAEQQGWDAVVIGILQDSGLQVARTLSPMPVVGYGQAAALIGRCLGDHLGVVAFNEDIFPLVHERLERQVPGSVHVLQKLDLEYSSVLQAFTDEEEAELLRRRFEHACEEAIHRGADVIVPGQMVLAEAVWRLGIRRVGDVPVLDGLGATISLASTLVALRRSGALEVCRRGVRWRTPKREVIELLLSGRFVQ